VVFIVLALALKAVRAVAVGVLYAAVANVQTVLPAEVLAQVEQVVECEAVVFGVPVVISRDGAAAGVGCHLQWMLWLLLRVQIENVVKFIDYFKFSPVHWFDQFILNKSTLKDGLQVVRKIP